MQSEGSAEGLLYYVKAGVSPETTADLQGSFGLRTGHGCGTAGEREAGCGFVVQSPAAAPGGPGCAEVGAELGPV